MYRKDEFISDEPANDFLNSLILKLPKHIESGFYLFHLGIFVGQRDLSKVTYDDVTEFTETFIRVYENATR